MTDPAQTPSYRALERLGSVFAGEIHVAEQIGDEGLVKQVRLWTIRPELLGGDGKTLAVLREDLGRAAQLTAGCVAQVLEVWETDSSLAFATEHLNGLTLREAFTLGQPLTSDGIAAIGLGLARACEHAHDSQALDRLLVHGDIRPEYVLLGHEGGVKLTGFGLGRFLPLVSPHGAWHSWEGHSYLAPERQDTWSMSPAGDIYSVGMILLEAACGRPDLSGRELSEVLAVLEAGGDPRDRGVAEIPTDLAQVIVGACASRRSDRYPSASALATDLHVLLLERRQLKPMARIVQEEVERLLPSGPDRGETLQDVPRSSVPYASVAAGAPPSTPPPVVGHLFGRTSILDTVDQALADIVTGRGQVIVLRGEPGMGRSRLLAEVAMRVSRTYTRAAWLQVSGRPAEHGVQYAAVLRLLGAAIGLGLEEELTRVGEEADRLRAFGFEAATIDAVRAVVGLADAPPDPARQAGLLSEAVYRCLERLSWEQTTVVAWDDLHWADDASMGCLLEALSRFGSLPAVALLTVSQKHRPAWSLPAGSTMVELGPLPREEAGQVVLQKAATGRQVESTFLELLMRHTGGNPLLLEETIDLLDEAGLLELVGEELRYRGSRDEPLPVLEDAVRARLARVDDETRVVAIAAAVAGRALDPLVINRATGIPLDTTDRMLRELVDVHGILEQNASAEFEFRNSRLRDAVLTVSEPGLRTMARRMMARAILESWAEPPAGLDDHVSTLLAQVGDEPGAASVLYRAAQRQEARGDLRGASERYAKALQLVRAARAAGKTTAGDELQLCIATGRTSVHSLSLDLGEWALRDAERLAADQGDARAGAEARVLISRLLTRRGKLREALEKAGEAMPLAENTGDLVTIAQVCAAMAETYQKMGEYGPDLDYIERALQLANDAADPERFGEYLQLAVLHALGVGEYDRTRELIAEARALAQGQDEPLLTIQMLKVEAALLQFFGDCEAALRLNLEGVALAHAHGLAEQEIMLIHNCGDCQLIAGRNGEALYYYSESLRRSRDARVDRLTEGNQMYIGYLEVVHLGLADDGLERLQTAIESAESTGRLWNLNQGLQLHGRALLQLGRRAEAVKQLEQALEMATRMGVRFFIDEATRYLEHARGSVA